METTLEANAHPRRFLSYSHKVDQTMAAELQRRIARLGTPWWQLRSRKVFRDETDLAATPSLWKLIQKNLAGSRHLILIASPESARSHWVAKELVYWLTDFQEEDPDHFDAMQIVPARAQTIALVITSGSMEWDEQAGDFHWPATDVLPPVLHGVFAEMPLWVDLRGYRDFPAPEGRAMLHAGAARLTSFISGIPAETLLAEEYRRQRQAIRHAVTALLLIVALLIGVSFLFVKRAVALREVRRETSRFYFAEALRRWNAGEHHEALAFLENCLKSDPEHPVAPRWAEIALATRNWPRPWSPPWVGGKYIFHTRWTPMAAELVAVSEEKKWQYLTFSPEKAEVTQSGPFDWTPTEANAPYFYRDRWLFLPTFKPKLIVEAGDDLYFFHGTGGLTRWAQGDSNRSTNWPLPPTFERNSDLGATYDSDSQRLWLWSRNEVLVFDADGPVDPPYPVAEIKAVVAKLDERERNLDQLLRPQANAGSTVSVFGIQSLGIMPSEKGPLLQAVVGNEIFVWNLDTEERVDLSAANGGPAVPYLLHSPGALAVPSKIQIPIPDLLHPFGVSTDLGVVSMRSPLLDWFNQRIVLSDGVAVFSVTMAGSPLPHFRRPLDNRVLDNRFLPGLGNVSNELSAQSVLIRNRETAVRGDQRNTMVSTHRWEVCAEELPGTLRDIDPTHRLAAVEPDSGTLQAWDLADRRSRPEPFPVPDHDSAKISADGKWTLMYKGFSAVATVGAVPSTTALLSVLEVQDAGITPRYSLALDGRDGDLMFRGTNWATNDARYFYTFWANSQNWKLRIHARDGTVVGQIFAAVAEFKAPTKMTVTRNGTVLLSDISDSFSAASLAVSGVAPRKLPPIPVEAGDQVLGTMFLDDQEAVVLTRKGLRRYLPLTGAWEGAWAPVVAESIVETRPGRLVSTRRLVDEGRQQGIQMVDLNRGTVFPEISAPLLDCQLADGSGGTESLITLPARDGWRHVRLVSWLDGETVAPEIELVPEEVPLTSEVWYGGDSSEILFFTRGCAHRWKLPPPRVYSDGEVETLCAMLRSVGAVDALGGALHVRTPGGTLVGPAGSPPAGFGSRLPVRGAGIRSVQAFPRVVL